MAIVKNNLKELFTIIVIGLLFQILVASQKLFNPLVIELLDIQYTYEIGINLILQSLAIFGVITLTAKIFNSNRTGLYSGLFIAVSPWLTWSVIYHPALVLAFIFVIFGLLLAITNKSLFSFVLLSGAMLVNFISLIIIPLLIIFMHKKFAIKRQLFITVIIVAFVLCMLWIPKISLLQDKYINVFTEIGYINNLNELRGQYNANTTFLDGRLLFNKSFFAVVALEKYLVHFNPSYLFARGDGQYPGNTSPILLVYLPFVVIGLVRVFRKITKSANQLIVFWLAISALPGIFILQSPQNSTFIFALFPLAVCSALGIRSTKKIWHYIFFGLLCVNLASVIWHAQI